MLNIDEELKQIYKNDILPISREIAYKQLILYFPELDLTITNNQIVQDSFSLEESLCSETDITFGSCESAEFRITVANVTHELKDQLMIVKQIVSDTYEMPLGIYIVDSAKRQSNRRFKDVVAYDFIKSKLDIDVAEWYNSLDFADMTLASFRSKLLSYLEIEEDSSKLPLPNDEMTVFKTIEPTQISARVILQSCEELNGCFGHINRYGKFTHVVLEPSYGLYPSIKLIPWNSLFPRNLNDKTYDIRDVVSMNMSMYETVRHEEYTVKEIDKVQIRTEEDDIGAIVGEGTNTYVIEGNFLVYGKTTEDLEEIATNVFGNIKNRYYVPFESSNIGLPYIELGDSITFEGENNVTGYVLRRKLTGIQALKDTYIATGNEQREENYGVNKEIITLKGKAAKIVKSVEEVKVTVSDLDTKLTGEIAVLAGQVVLKVDSNGNLGTIELNADPDTDLTEIKIKANNISLEGLVTVNGNLKVLEDGTLEAVNARFSGEVYGSTVTGSAIETYGDDGYFKSTSWNGESFGVYENEILVQNGILRCARTLYTNGGQTVEWASSLSYNTLSTGTVNTNNIFTSSIGTGANPVNNIYFYNMRTPSGSIQIETDGSTPYIFVSGNSGSVAINDGNVSCSKVNGYTPITTGNKNSYTYPPESHTHNYASVGHTHSGYASTSALIALESRVSALESK